MTAHAQAPAAVTPEIPAPADGKSIYESACLSCHGTDGRGLPQALVGFEVPVPDFTDCSFATREPDADWASVIRDGGPARAFDRRMPAYGGVLSEEQIASVLVYVRRFCPSESWPRGELNLPRPLRTEKAYPEDEAVMTMTFSGGRGTAGAAESRFVYEHRLGPRNQWEVIVPLAAKDGEAGWQQGLGDVVFGFKRALYHDARRGSIVSAGGEAIFPTGKEDRGLGSGTTIIEPFVLYGQMLPRDTFLHMHGAVELPTDSDKAGREALWRTAFGWTYSRNGGRAWSPMLELLAARELESGATTHWDLVPQMQVTLSRRQHIMASAGVQMPVNDREGRATRVMFYILWDWFDGGLFEGWR